MRPGIEPRSPVPLANTLTTRPMSRLHIYIYIVQIRRTRHAGYCWRSRDKVISDILLWTSSHGRANAGRPAWTNIQQLCTYTGCSPEDLPEAMDDKEGWRERVRDIWADSAMMMMMIVLQNDLSCMGRKWKKATWILFKINFCYRKEKYFPFRSVILASLCSEDCMLSWSIQSWRFPLEFRSTPLVNASTMAAISWIKSSSSSIVCSLRLNSLAFRYLQRE